MDLISPPRMTTAKNNNHSSAKPALYIPHITDGISIAEGGAAECIGGSRTFISVYNNLILQDIGKDYTAGEDGYHLIPLNFDARMVKLLVLSHGHADHIGDILKLFESGFRGPIYATKATYDIVAHQIKQEKDNVFWHNKSIKGQRYTSGPKKGQFVEFRPPIKKEEVYDLTALFKGDAQGPGFVYNETQQLATSVKATFYEAGHIPGSAQVFYEITTKDGKKLHFVTAVDFGRTYDDIPILKSPERNLPHGVDFALLESTYGNKVHRPLAESIDMLAKSVNDVQQRGGVLLVPTFSIMRDHMLRNFIYRLYQEKKIPPDFTFYHSSPSASEIDKVILAHPEDMDDRAHQEFSGETNPFHFPQIVEVKDGKKFKEILDTKQGPYGVIAASGMMDMGRIVPALKRKLPDKKNIVLITGYTAPATRGNRLERGEKRIEFTDDGKTEWINVEAEIRRMGGLSGHADSRELTDYVRHLVEDLNDGKQLKGIFIKHGEPEGCAGLREVLLENHLGTPDSVTVMKLDQEYRLDDRL